MTTPMIRALLEKVALNRGEQYLADRMGNNASRRGKVDEMQRRAAGPRMIGELPLESPQEINNASVGVTRHKAGVTAEIDAYQKGLGLQRTPGLGKAVATPVSPNADLAHATRNELGAVNNMSEGLRTDVLQQQERGDALRSMRAQRNAPVTEVPLAERLAAFKANRPAAPVAQAAAHVPTGAVAQAAQTASHVPGAAGVVGQVEQAAAKRVAGGGGKILSRLATMGTLGRVGAGVAALGAGAAGVAGVAGAMNNRAQQVPQQAAPVAAIKAAAAALHNNENDSTKGEPNIDKKPEGRQPAGSLGAPWGETPADPKKLAPEVTEIHDATRIEEIHKLLDSARPAAKAEKALISQHLDVSGYDSHYALLQKKASTQRPDGSTLRDQLARIR